MATIALGATVLTAVPLAVMPVAAYACSDSQSACDEGSLDPGDWDSGAGEYVESTGDWDASSMPVVQLPELEIVGQRIPPPLTPEALPSNYGLGSLAGGGSSGGGTTATVVAQGQKQEGRTACLRNDSPSTVKLTQTLTYTVSYQVSASVSTAALQALTATLGVQLNTTLTRSAGVEVTLDPGQSWALFIEFQTVVYKIQFPDILGIPQDPEFAEVVQPTGVVTARTC